MAIPETITESLKPCHMSKLFIRQRDVYLRKVSFYGQTGSNTIILIHIHKTNKTDSNGNIRRQLTN